MGDHRAPEADSSDVTIGVDIGGTKILGLVLDAGGTVLHERRCPTPDDSSELPDAVAAMIAELRDVAPAVVGAGVGVAGMVDRDGVLVYAPNLPGLRHAPLRSELSAATGLPVVVDNDANVAALGEVALGAAVGVPDALVVTLGTGIGGGVVVGGELLRGAHGFAAEIGHFTVDRDGPCCSCGERGHWEAIASGTALGRLGRELVDRGAGRAILAAAGGNRDEIVGEHVGAAAAAGDAEARTLVAELADNVALGLAGLAAILDPEVVVVGGGLVELGPLLFEPMTEAFGRHLEAAASRPPLPIRPAALGERSAAVGAAVLAHSEAGRR